MMLLRALEGSMKCWSREWMLSIIGVASDKLRPASFSYFQCTTDFRRSRSVWSSGRPGTVAMKVSAFSSSSESLQPFP